jgi:hypothetical protein
MFRETLRARIHRPIAAAAVVLGLGWSAEALAADETADALTSEAKLLMEQKRYKDACPKLATSHRRDPSGERILELATCHKEEGRIATAYYELREAIDIARRDGRRDRVKVATAMLEEIEPKIPKISLTVSLRAASLPGFEIKRDGMPLRQSEWSTSFPVDPGVHTILAKAEGRKPMLKTLELVADGTNANVMVLDLDPVEQSSTVLTPALPPARDKSTSSFGVQRTAGVIVGGAGALAVGLGAVLSVRAGSAQRESEQHCAGNVCNAQGRELRDSAETLGTTGALSLIGGGVMAAGGLLLFFTAPTMAPPVQGAGVTTVSLGPAGGMIRGQW